MIKVGIFGCFGKMGKALVQLQNITDRDFIISCVTARKEKQKITNEEQEIIEGIYYTTENEELFARADVVVEFTSNKGMKTALELSKKFNTPLVSGTTGHDNFSLLKEVGKVIPVLWAPNMSPGINFFLHFIQRLPSDAFNNYDIGIMDVHHSLKKDNPSGTALFLQKYICDLFNVNIDNISIASLRLGEVVGEHTITLAGAGEKIMLIHQAENRSVFANGAIKAAKWLTEQKPGLYSMMDIYERK